MHFIMKTMFIINDITSLIKYISNSSLIYCCQCFLLTMGVNFLQLQCLKTFMNGFYYKTY